MLPLCVYLIYKDANTLQKIVRSGKNLKRGIYPAIYVAIHSYSLTRALSGSDGPEFEKIVSFEAYAPTLITQASRLAVYCKTHYTIVNKENEKNRIIKAHAEYVDFLWRKSLDDAKAASLHEQKNMEVISLDQFSDTEVRVFDVSVDPNNPFWSMRPPAVITEPNQSVIQKNTLEIQIPVIEVKPQVPYKVTKMDLEKMLLLHNRFIEKITDRYKILPPEISVADDLILDEMVKGFLSQRRRIVPLDPKKNPDLREKSLFDQDDD